MFFRVSLCLHANVCSPIATLMCTHANVMVVIDVLVTEQNVGESGYGISSWSASTGYSALVLTEGAKVDSSLTCQL